MGAEQGGAGRLFAVLGGYEDLGSRPVPPLMESDMSEKRKTPYQRLLDEIKEYVRNVQYRHEVTMWSYPDGKLHEGWRLDALHQRVQAASQLGYDVILVAKDDALVVRYKKRVPDPSWSWQ